MVTFLTAAGMPDVKERLMRGDAFAGRNYRAHADGYNMLDYFGGKTKKSPRREFWYVNDDGQIVAARWQDWKVVFLENRGEAFGVWREPLLSYAYHCCLICGAIPSRRLNTTRTRTMTGFWIGHSSSYQFRVGAARFLQTMKDYPPSQSPGSFNLSKIEEQLRSTAR